MRASHAKNRLDNWVLQNALTRIPRQVFGNRSCQVQARADSGRFIQPVRCDVPTPESLFSIANAAAIAAWALLALAPGWRWTDTLVRSGAWSLALSAAYLVFIVIGMGGGGQGGFGSLRDVRTLFGNDMVLLAGWVHYLAFDLYVGAITTRIARRENIPHLAMLPVLFLTFMFGPVGLLAFWLVRSVRAKDVVAATP